MSETLHCCNLVLGFQKKEKKTLKEIVHSWNQSGLDWVTPRGARTRCSSILLDCERTMRLKKSSSGTVGPLLLEGGAAHL